LRVHDIAANCAEAILDAESALPATLIGLTRNPGKVCLDYVNGRRKHYMNPFTFMLVALTAQIVLDACLRWTGWVAQSSHESDVLPDDAVTWILFAVLIPLSFLWTRLFAVSQRNFAENYVLGLFLVGQFAYVELALMPLSFLTASDTILSITFSIIWLSVTTWAGVRFYSMPWYSVFWRMFVSTAAALLVSGGLFLAVTETINSLRSAEITR